MNPFSRCLNASRPVVTGPASQENSRPEDDAIALDQPAGSPNLGTPQTNDSGSDKPRSMAAPVIGACVVTAMVAAGVVAGTTNLWAGSCNTQLPFWQDCRDQSFVHSINHCLNMTAGEHVSLHDLPGGAVSIALDHVLSGVPPQTQMMAIEHLQCPPRQGEDTAAYVAAIAKSFVDQLASLASSHPGAASAISRDALAGLVVMTALHLMGII